MACFFVRSNFQIIIEFLYLMRYIKNKKAGMDLSGFKQREIKTTTTNPSKTTNRCGIILRYAQT
ncbi:hypothetical protein E1X26_05420 [Listeria innocua]|nr:hypothetical protein [Listeria innocua]